MLSELIYVQFCMVQICGHRNTPHRSKQTFRCEAAASRVCYRSHTSTTFSAILGPHQYAELGPETMTPNIEVLATAY